MEKLGLSMVFTVSALIENLCPFLTPCRWGFIITGSGVPRNQLPLISRSIDIPYYTIPCRYAFNITSPPDTESINKYGGWNISYPRLAIIDGQADPWRPATPHADQAPRRPNTIDKPFILIEGAVHHCEYQEQND